MKSSVRKNVFETNSSSVHAIAINTKEDVSDVKFDVTKDASDGYVRTWEVATPEYFGWDREKLYYTEQKISYYISACVSCSYWDWGEDVTEKRINYAVEHVREVLNLPEDVEIYDYSRDGDHGWEQPEVDHGYNLDNFVKRLNEDDDLFRHYLLGWGSFVTTGNDNGEEYPDLAEIISDREEWTTLGDYEIYVKGN